MKSAKDANDAFMVSFDDLRQLDKQIGRQDTSSLSGLADGDFALCTSTSGGQSTSSRLVSMSVADSPMPEAKDESAVSIAPLGGFFQAYRRAAVCASTDDTRHELNGIFWDAEQGMLVGTDGRRLAMPHRRSDFLLRWFLTHVTIMPSVFSQFNNLLYFYLSPQMKTCFTFYLFE